MPVIKGKHISMYADIHTSGGGDLPELDNPAASGDILADKEAIDGNGSKLTGTLEICDSLELDEVAGSQGAIEFDVVSSKDGSSKAFQITDEDFREENIKSGVDIFGVEGTLNYIAEKQSVPETKATDIIKVGSTYYLWE